jgi:hypothetical protein
MGSETLFEDQANPVGVGRTRSTNMLKKGEYK